MLECEVCRARPDIDSSVILYRVNKTGEEGLWRCEKHLEGFQPSADLRSLVEIIRDNAP